MPYPTQQHATAPKPAGQAKEYLPTQFFTGLNQLYALNVATSQSVIEEFTHYAQEVMGAKGPQEWFALHTGLFEALTEKFSAYLRDTRDLAESSETGFPNALGADLNEVKKMLSGVFENPFRYTPAGAGYIPTGSKDRGDATQNLIE